MHLSAHFMLEELVYSQVASRRGIDNTPGPANLENLTRLCETVLEPLRELLGVPLHIDSGYRSGAVNSIVGGAVDSAHMFGRAADILPLSAKSPEALEGAFNLIRGSFLPFDQVILECRAWIHVSIPTVGGFPRRQALIATGNPGAWKYHVAGATP